MPELAELKFTSDYVNQVSEGMTYVGVKKNPKYLKASTTSSS